MRISGARTREEVETTMRLRFGQAIARVKRTARREPWDGKTPPSTRHKLLIQDWDEQARCFSLLLTFDVGYHACGWWRNSQYDRCWHLSFCIATYDALETPTLAEQQGVARAFFDDAVRVGWVEPPAGDFDAYRNAPASKHTYHLRIFVDPKTDQPIQPQGEVYDLVPFADGTSPVKVFR